MSALPPYSTYRTDSKQMLFPQATSHGNILTFTPPGFGQQLSVKFPDSRLAVCAKCKKNFKTRDMCRVRNTHTSEPWTTAYVCITLDDSCLDEHGKYVDKPMTVRMVQWQPYCVMKPFDSKTPVCASCKRTNRTRSFCRERHKHRHLPWCTVYVILSTLESVDPTTVVAGASTKVDPGESTSNGSAKVSPDDSKKSDTSNSAGGDTITSEGDDGGDDINNISESRTFLAKVSCRSTSVHWLELADSDNEAISQHFATPADVQGYASSMSMDPSQMTPYGYQAYAAQQHQHVLKSRQQYFFQMQQQQQQYPGMPPPPQGHHWQPPYHHPPPGQAESGATAGEAAAAQRRVRGNQGSPGDDGSRPHPPAPQWHLYYPAPPPHYAPPGTEAPERDEEYHTPPESIDGDPEEQPDAKKARVV